MIWSLAKILIFVAATALLAYAGGLLIESEGQIRVIAMGTEITLGPLQAVVLAVIIVFLIWGLIRLLGLLVATVRFVNGDETAISRYFDRNRERRGFEALADGMMALASGEGRLAMTKAARAEKYLARPELTNLLAAQAAELAGDKPRAQEVYKRLLQDDRTRFVGVRGLMKQKLAERDTDTALLLAERAFALKPRHEETADILLRLQAEKEDWSGARRTLGAKLRAGALPRDVHRRRDAVLALSEAGSSEADEADVRALEANRLSPDLVPGAVAAARALIRQGRSKQAAKTIRKAWEVQPHPDLAAAFAEIEPKETPEDRVSRFQPLLKINPDHDENRLLATELAIAAEDFEQARSALGDLPKSHPTARSLALMAAVERGAGSEEQIVRDYLVRAVNAPRGSAWVCDNCQSIAPEWSPVCSNCKSLDTLSWRAPVSGVGGDITSMPVPAEFASISAEPAVDTEAEIIDLPPLPDVEPIDDFESDDGGAKPN